MTNEQIVKKSIEKAVKNGWKPFGLLEGWLDGKIGVGMNPNLYVHLLNWNEYFVYIYNQNFAKAFWGEGKMQGGGFNMARASFESVEYDIFAWQYHLQQMVLEEEPLKYLAKFL